MSFVAFTGKLDEASAGGAFLPFSGELDSPVDHGPADDSDPLTRITPSTGEQQPTLSVTAEKQAGAGRGFVNPPDAADFGTRDVGAAESLGLGAGRSASSTAKVGTLVAVAPVVVAEKIKNALTGSQDTTGQDAVFSQFMDPLQKTVDWYALAPGERQGFLAKVADGVGGMLADLPLMLAAGGMTEEAKAVQAAPEVSRFVETAVSRGFDAMRPVMVKAGVEKAQQVLDAGGTVQQALTSATTAALVTGFMGSQPMSARGTVAERILTGIPVGAITSEAHRSVQNAADPAAIQQPFSLGNMAVGATTNAVMAGAMGEPAAARPEARLAPEPRPSEPSAPAAEPRAADQPQPDPVAEVRAAPTVDDAIKAATDVISTPPPAGATAVESIGRILDRELSAEPTSVADQLRAIRPLDTPEAAPSAEPAGATIEQLLAQERARTAAEPLPAQPAALEPGAAAAAVPREAAAVDAAPSPEVRPLRRDEELLLRPNQEPAGMQAPVAAMRTDGTLAIAGNSAALMRLLRASGITQILPSHDGVLIGRSEAEAAQRVIAPFAAVPRITPEGALHADSPGRKQAGIQPERANGDEGRPAAEAGGGDRVLGAEQGAGQEAGQEARPEGAGPQPLSVWFGRAGDGYATKQDALNAMPARQRAQPDLVWQVEPMPSGKHRLAGYAASDEQAQQQTKPAELERDPFRTFLIRNGIALPLAKDFTPGVRERLAMGRTFRHDGLQMDQLAERAAEQGYIRDRHDTDGLYDLISRSVNGERVGALYGRDGDRELQARMEQRNRMEQEQAVAALGALADNELVAVSDAFDGVPSLDAASNTTAEAAMRALGFTEQEIADAIAHESRSAQAHGAGSGEAGEAAAGQAADRDRAGESQARPEHAAAAGEGLTRPSREDILAQQGQRAAGEHADAQRRTDEAARASADAQRGDFALTGSDRASDANSAQRDLTDSAVTPPAAKEVSSPPPPEPAADRSSQRQLIELRKRKSVLESLVKCLG